MRLCVGTDGLEGAEKSYAEAIYSQVGVSAMAVSKAALSVAVAALIVVAAPAAHAGPGGGHGGSGHGGHGSGGHSGGGHGGRSGSGQSSGHVASAAHTGRLSAVPPSGAPSTAHGVPRSPVYGWNGYAVAPVHFTQPYYVFHPHVVIGVGLCAGFPIAYPSRYGYYFAPYYPYSFSFAGGYLYPDPGYESVYPPPGFLMDPPVNPPPSSIGVQPGSPGGNMGGVSFEITPTTAEIIVDGIPVGRADQFTPTTQPLGLTPGRHHVEIRALDYRTLAFDVDVVAGQVIPYRIELQR